MSNTGIMENINTNIRFLRKQKGLTQQQFADLLKIGRPALGAYEEGRAKPPLDIQKVLARMFDLSLDQLLTRDLSKVATRTIVPEGMEADDKDAQGKSLRVLSITVDRQGRENIDLVPAKAAAGYLNGYADPEFVEELPKFRLPMLPEGTYRAFEISGDSMQPLQSGSIVVAEYVSNWLDVRDGQTYIILTKSEGIVYKRLFSEAEKGRLLLRSDNPSYEPYYVPLDDILELWKAKLFISHAPADTGASLDKMMKMMMELQQEVIRLKTA